MFSSHLIDVENQIRRAMSEVGINPPESIRIDGEIHRFDVDRRGDQAGWYCFFAGAFVAGTFGNWKTGESHKWIARNVNALSSDRLAEYQQSIAQDKYYREQKRKQAQKQIALEAQAIWAGCNQPPESHPYLKRKGIKPHTLKIAGDLLVVPIFFEDQIVSLQYIASTGRKKFLKGGRIKGAYSLIGDVKSAPVILICEGYSTGATLYEELGVPVYCALCANNLKEVAKTVRAKYPESELVIAGDNDHATEGNPGLKYARDAAIATHAKCVIPDFSGIDASEKDTDFNDRRRLAGSIV